jgi:hypothetical protein
VFSQDTIWFLSGERLITSNYTIKIEDGMLNYFNKRNKEKHIGLEYVYSVNEKSGAKKIYYEPTVMDNTPFSVDQMWSFIRGEYEAQENYHPVGSTIIGVTAGAGSVYLVTLISGSPFLSPLIPAAGSAITGLTDIPQKNIQKKYPQYSDNEFFIAGYREIGNQKRVSNSIKGGLLGLVLGIASAIVISNTVD